jgi:hypothetical protein
MDNGLINGHRKLCPACLHVSGIPQTENGTHGKRQLPFVCCKRKTETAYFHLFAGNGIGKRKFIFLDGIRQMVVSCFSKDAHLCRFCFPFVANRRSCRFPLVPFSLYIYIWNTELFTLGKDGNSSQL